MKLQNIQCCHSGKNLKLSLVYVGLAIFLFYNIQTLILESSGNIIIPVLVTVTVTVLREHFLFIFVIGWSEKLVNTNPQTYQYQQPRQEENISVRPGIKEDGQSTAKPDSAGNKTDTEQKVWISMGE